MPLPPAAITASKASRANGKTDEPASAPNSAAEITLPVSAASLSMSKATMRLAAMPAAAITAVLSSLKSGDLVLAEENVYGCTFRIFARVFEKFGLVVRYVDFANPSNYDAIVEALCTEYDVDRETAMSDVHQLIADLEETSLITKSS